MTEFTTRTPDTQDAPAVATVADEIEANERGHDCPAGGQLLYVALTWGDGYAAEVRRELQARIAERDRADMTAPDLAYLDAEEPLPWYEMDAEERWTLA